jgi:8-oxo-dGTP pyrophosphatase MutT (NUDIX family)
MNSELYDNKYRIPTPILMKINAKLMTSPVSDGTKRAKNLVKGGIATYQQLKRLKNFFDYFNPEVQGADQYELIGGEDMKNWVEETLGQERKKTETSKEVKSSINTKSQFSMPTANIAKVHESKQMLTSEREIKRRKLTEEDVDSGLTKNANVVLFNNDKRFLLLKRSSYPDQWQPNKWCMVGGGVEEGEEPIDAAKRELKEETGLVIDKFMEKFVIQRDDNVEHVFIAKYDGDVFNVKLDKEHQGFVWVTFNEIKFLDTAPNVEEYIKLALTKYNDE